MAKEKNKKKNKKKDELPSFKNVNPKKPSKVKDFFGTIMYGKNYKKSDLNVPDETVQDLIKYDEITDKGIVIADGSYFAMIEVSQLNSNLLDFQESSSVWLNFSTMLNSINVRHSFILQNQFYDVNDFVTSFEQLSTNLTNLTPELEMAREDAIDYYRNFSEERNLDQRGYMIYRFNPLTEGIEVGMSSGNAKIDEFFTKLKTTNATVDKEENRNIAISMLDEVCDLTYQLLYSIGCPSLRLNKEGILEYIYGVLNRDVVVQQRLSDAAKFGYFNPRKESNTPGIMLDVIESLSKNDSVYQDYYEHNVIEYEDDESVITYNQMMMLLEGQTLEAEEEQPLLTSEKVTDTAIEYIPPSKNEQKEVEQVSTQLKFNTSEITQNKESEKEIQTSSNVPSIEITSDEITSDETTSNTESNRNTTVSVDNVVQLDADERKRRRRAEARRKKKERLKAERSHNTFIEEVSN